MDVYLCTWPLQNTDWTWTSDPPIAKPNQVPLAWVAALLYLELQKNMFQG